MNRLLFVAGALLLGSCLTSQSPEHPAGQVSAEKTSPPPEPWVFSLDRDGLVLDGKRVAVNDHDAFKRALYSHWGQEPILEVSADVPALEVGWVWTSARLAKVLSLKTKSGNFSREFSTKYLRDDLGDSSQTFHVVGGEVVRFQHFGAPKGATQPGTFEGFDWKIQDESSGKELRTWLERNIAPRDLALLVSPQKLPFGELMRVVARLNELWPALSSVRVGVHAAPVELDAPLETRFAAGSLPPSVTYASTLFVDDELEQCYLRSPERASQPVSKAIFTLTVDANGTVSAVPAPESTIKDAATLECMLAGVRKVRFPKRAGVPPTETTAGFVYRPKKGK